MAVAPYRPAARRFHAAAKEGTPSMLVSTSMRTGGTPITIRVRGFWSFASVMLGGATPRNSTMFARTRRAFAGVGATRTSISFVAHLRELGPRCHLAAHLRELGPRRHLAAHLRDRVENVFQRRVDHRPRAYRVRAPASKEARSRFEAATATSTDGADVDSRVGSTSSASPSSTSTTVAMGRVAPLPEGTRVSRRRERSGERGYGNGECVTRRSHPRTGVPPYLSRQRAPARQHFGNPW